MVARRLSTDRRCNFAQSALTIPELLVVLAIILLLLAMLIPGLTEMREQARKMLCANNLGQWGKALQMYRMESGGYLPTEGHGGVLTLKGGAKDVGFIKPGTWYNTLPQYLDEPAYKDIEGANVAIKERPNIHVWICPSKNMTDAYKSDSGKNQFHYAMNGVLDGMGGKTPSKDTPGFGDLGDAPLRSERFLEKPTTIFMFEIVWNSPGGSPRDVATMYQKFWGSDAPLGRFHGDYANLLYLDGAVTFCNTDDLVAEKDFRRGEIRWRHPRMYWGYPRE